MNFQINSFINLPFFGKKHRIYAMVVSFYRCKDSIEEDSYRFIVLTFYGCKNNVLLLSKYRFINAFYRFIAVAVNVETILTVHLNDV